MDIDDIRKNIDEVDDKLAALFMRRMELSRLIAEEKRKAGLPLVNALREEEIISRVTATLPEDVKPYGKQLFETLFETSKPHLSSIKLTRANTIMLTTSTKNINVVPQRLCCLLMPRAFSTVRSSPCSKQLIVLCSAP